MARYIDADELLKYIKANAPYMYTMVAIMAGVIPTADVVEVVRCKDCGHYINGWCEIFKHESPTEDGFCCYGERRTDNG